MSHFEFTNEVGLQHCQQTISKDEIPLYVGHLTNEKKMKIMKINIMTVCALERELF
jgi:hypothetical protein